MRTMDELTAATFRPTRAELSDARHLPGYVYTSTEFEALEKDKIFMQDWLCVGRVEEIAAPGDYQAIRIHDEPVLLVRNGAGKIHAFANVCRHRGVEVAPQGHGNAKEFLCPYHSWAYDLDGRLLAAPLTRGTTMDFANCRLPELKLVEWRGWMFLSFAAEPRSFDEIIAPFDAEFGLLQPENCVLAEKTVLELNCNWKFVVENLMDVYHIGTVHTRSFGGHYQGDKEKYKFKLLPHGIYSFFFDAAPISSDGTSRFGQMPWMKPYPQSFACLGFLPPNLNISARCDTVRHWVTWPLSPARSQLISYTLVAKNAPQQPGYAAGLEDHISMLKMAIDEDRAMVESLQNGVRSRRFDPGPLTKLEGPIHHIMNNYIDEMTA